MEAYQSDDEGLFSRPKVFTVEKGDNLPLKSSYNHLMEKHQSERLGQILLEEEHEQFIFKAHSEVVYMTFRIIYQLEHKVNLIMELCYQIEQQRHTPLNGNDSHPTCSHIIPGRMVFHCHM